MTVVRAVRVTRRARRKTSPARCFSRGARRPGAVAHAGDGRLVYAGRPYGLALPIRSARRFYCLSGVGRICIGKGSRPQATLSR